MIEPGNSLDFRILEDIVTVRHRKSDALPAVVNRLAFNQLGPTLAYAVLARPHVGDPYLPLPGHDVRALREYVSLRRQGTLRAQPLSTSFEPRNVELSWIPASDDEVTDVRFEAFKNRAERAARAAGFGTSFAPALIGALGEMADNVLVHSDEPGSGFAAYAWKPGEFEYVVSDAGRGILASLRSCAEFQTLRNAAEAVGKAVEPRVSRFGLIAGRGMGFGQVIKSLTRLTGTIHVHSDDACVEMQGISPGLEQRKVRQTFVHQGVFVSVSVRPA